MRVRTARWVVPRVRTVGKWPLLFRFACGRSTEQWNLHGTRTSASVVLRPACRPATRRNHLKAPGQKYHNIMSVFNFFFHLALSAALRQHSDWSPWSHCGQRVSQQTGFHRAAPLCVQESQCLTLDSGMLSVITSPWGDRAHIYTSNEPLRWTDTQMRRATPGVRQVSRDVHLSAKQSSTVRPSKSTPDGDWHRGTSYFRHNKFLLSGRR